MYFIFRDYYRPMIWGCERWILSAYPQMESIVTNGTYAGYTLSQLIAQLGDTLMGKQLWQRYGANFPLLIKFIEANDPLSIQVHPSDALAQRQGKGSVGKTEMWYALPCAKDAYLLSGLKRSLTPETYKEHVANHTIVDDLARYTLQEGDCFFLPAGRIHAIGSGCHLLEIQQSSDLTYRIYDYDRRDAKGQLRELHTDLAAESIDYTVLPDYRTSYQQRENVAMPLVQCPYFETTAYQVTKQVTIDWANEDRFLVLIITAGAGRIEVDGEIVEVTTGDTILLPATTQRVVASGTFTFLTTTCPQ
ncbi:MAG: AraC family ligand binding domain-containing protein [Bacteroidales bacterium]|nr:AraC family ligand binding domain-containing protein [Bacteroidales bacterium]